MNCQELTEQITNIKAQITGFDSAVGARDPKEAINIKNDIIKQFNGELKEYADTFYENPTPENYDKEVNRIINKIGDKDPSEVSFSRKELIFIYDTDDKAKYRDFNKESVSKIKEIREKRKLKQKEDASIIFNLPTNQIVFKKEHIAPNTKFYIGPLFTGIFNLPNLEHIYTSFPEGKIRRGEFVTCGKNGPELLDEHKAMGTNLYGSAESMLQSSEFVVHEPNETIFTIHLKVSDLFPDGKAHTYDEIITRAKELGLDNNLPHETAANLLLNESTQPNLGQRCSVASKTITDRGGNPRVFSLERNSDDSWLSSRWTKPSFRWYADDELSFCLRPSTRA